MEIPGPTPDPQASDLESLRCVAGSSDRSLSSSTRSTHEDKYNLLIDVFDGDWHTGFDFLHMLAQTTDSGANNNTMAMEMSRIFREGESPVYWDAKNNHVRCYAHKLALVVKAGLRSIGIDPGHTKPTTTPGRGIPTPILALDDLEILSDNPKITKQVDTLEDGEDIAGYCDGDTNSETEDDGKSVLQTNLTSRWQANVAVQAVKKVGWVIH